MITTIKNLTLLSFLSLIMSCTINSNEWHEAASKLGKQSIYISKDGQISAKINNKISSNPKINVFDAKSADIGYASLNILYKNYKYDYIDNPDFNSVYILDLRQQAIDFKQYVKIINDQKNNNR